MRKITYKANADLDFQEFESLEDLKAAYEEAGISFEFSDEPSEGVDYEVVDYRTAYELREDAKKVVDVDFADYKAKNAEADYLVIWKALRQAYEDGEALVEMRIHGLTTELAEAMHTIAREHEEAIEQAEYIKNKDYRFIKIKYVDRYGKDRVIYADDAIDAAYEECCDYVWYEQTTAKNLKELCEDNEDTIPAWLAALADGTPLYRADHLLMPIDSDLENLYREEPIDKLEAVKAWLVHDGGHIVEWEE